MYYPNATKGSIRLATALGRTGLRNDVWRSLEISPQPFGFPVGYWFDFPDIATTDTHLYVTVNVITPTPGQNVDSLVLKLPLAELRSGAAMRAVYWTRGQTLGPGRNFRLAQGATHTMFFGTILDTATVRVFRNPDRSDVVTLLDRPIAFFNNQDSGYVSRLRNGVNWADRALPFVKGAYATEREYGLLWHSGLHGSRPLPYVRVVRFSTADDSLIAEEDLWSASLAWLYPAATTNAVGHIAVTAAAGGAALDPVSAVLVVDNCQPTFAGFPVAAFALSTHPPSYAGWGDYFSLQRHPARTLTFVTSGLAQTGGSAVTDQHPQFMHFGRMRDQLAWSSVIIRSTGTVSVPIGLSPRDELSQTTVATPGYGSWQPTAGYALTAPAQHVSGPRTFEFQRWRHRSAPHAAWADLPAGQRTLTVAAIGDDDDEAEAVYAERIAGRATLFGATAGALCLGGSDAQWGSIALPLRLDFLGADPGCQLLVAAEVIVPLPVDGTGAGSIALALPNDRLLIGGRAFSQVVVLDPGVVSPAKLVVSNGLGLVVGGLR